MKIVIQRVKQASAAINGAIHSSIGKGLLLLFGVEKNDNAEFINILSNKVLNLRIFSDENGKMNLSVKDIKGEILVVSQFTLAADCEKGTRPSFDNAEMPELANKIYETFVSELTKAVPVKTGVFGAKMEISLVNDGPVTFILEKS